MTEFNRYGIVFNIVKGTMTNDSDTKVTINNQHVVRTYVNTTTYKFSASPQTTSSAIEGNLVDETLLNRQIYRKYNSSKSDRNRHTTKWWRKGKY
jgi:hypothetical protein